jgi:hypothetical protein
MLTPGDVERRIVTHLSAWMPTMLAAVERHAELDAGALPAVRAYERASEFEKPDEVVPPVVILVVPDVPDVEQDGEGRFRATFTVDTGVLVEAGGQDSWNAARDLAGWYAWALVKSLLSPGLDAYGVTWRGAEFDAIPYDAHRTMAAARLPFAVTFEDVLEQHVGPLEPLEDPYVVPDDPPDVTGSDVSVTYDDPEED